MQRLYWLAVPLALTFSLALAACIPSKPPVPQAAPGAPAPAQPAVEPTPPATENTAVEPAAGQLTMPIEDTGKGIPTGVRIEKKPEGEVYEVIGKIGNVGTLTGAIKRMDETANLWEFKGALLFSSDKHGMGKPEAMVMPNLSIGMDGTQKNSTLVVINIPVMLPPLNTPLQPANLEFPIALQFTATLPVEFNISFTAGK